MYVVADGNTHYLLDLSPDLSARNVKKFSSILPVLTSIIAVTTTNTGKRKDTLTIANTKQACAKLRLYKNTLKHNIHPKNKTSINRKLRNV